VKLFRICRARYGTPAAAFSGEGASKIAHRWNHPDLSIRAVYCSDNLALACLENLVHLRPLPRIFPKSIFYEVNVPDVLLEQPPVNSLPAGWNASVPGNASRDFGMEFLQAKRAVGLVVPTVIQPIGFTIMLNPLHPRFNLAWASGPFDYDFDARLE
jgi:RES domain-containing protein